MRKKNNWLQKQRIIVILILILLIAVLFVAAKIGLKSGSRPHKVTENAESIIEEEQTKVDSNSKANTGYGYEMMQATWTVYDKSEKGDTSNVVLSEESVREILDKLESMSVSAFFSGREDAMRNVGVFDTFLKNAQSGKKGSTVVYEVHEDGGIGRNKYIFDGENMYVLYVGSVWSGDKDVISIDTTYTRIKEWDYTKDGRFTGEYCVPEPPEVSETVDGRFRILLEK